MHKTHGCISLKYFNCLRIVILLKYCAAMPQNCDVRASIEVKNRAKGAKLLEDGAARQN
jgi:hypothetical protein